MKKLYTLLLVLFIFAHAKAQYVTIPDTAFAKFLKIEYPSAMSGNLLDTSNSLIINDTFLNCSYKGVTNLYGVQFFDKLIHLRCTGNYLTGLPTLPHSLRNLECDMNNLTSLPLLPDSLTALDCDHNNLSGLPALPATLTSLYCNSNALSSLPILPNLTYLFCIGNNLTSLPTLPANLTYLNCSTNSLTSLPALPTGLKQFSCYQNNLSVLPALPDSLNILYCQENSLTSIPALPNFLYRMNCSKNNILSIKNIPKSLLAFNCQNNTNLYCLPVIVQDSFFEFEVKTNTGITCLPKKVKINWPSDSTIYLPVCSPSSGCPIAYNLLGSLHEDSSASCLLDSLHNGVVLKNIKLKKYKNGILDHQTYTDKSGFYSFDADITDSIDIIVDTVGKVFLQSCPVSGRRSARISLSDSMFYFQDFGIKCKGVDFGISSIAGRFRKGNIRPVYINAGDLSQQYQLNCGKGISGTITTTISGSASYDSPQSGALTPTSISGSTISYTIADFGAINMSTAFNILVKTDSSAVLGSSICIKTVVTTAAADIDHLNDSLTYCGVVVNSFDPNEKLVYPAAITGADEWLTYTINFQNTGTDTAYHIIVRDTLDSHLNPGTFTYLASSHNPQINISGHAVMFNFPHINLLDSFHNEPESHGWLQYKIKTVSDLAPYATVKNRASIYFDENDPILTNTTSNINEPLGIQYTNSLAGFRLYPNPASTAITLESRDAGELKVFNLLGSLVYQSSIVQPNTSTNIILPKLADGLYIYQFVSDKNLKHMGKLLIQKN